MDGAANSALIGLLTEALQVPRSWVVLERGLSARNKLVAVHGLEVEALLAVWSGLSCHA